MRIASTIVTWITGIASIVGEILTICFLPDKSHNAWIIALFIILMLIQLEILILREGGIDEGKNIVALGVMTILFVSVPGGILTVILGCASKKEQNEKSHRIRIASTIVTWITGIALIIGEIIAASFLSNVSQNIWATVLLAILILIQIAFLVTRESEINRGTNLITIGILTTLFLSIPGGIITIVHGNIENKERSENTLKIRIASTLVTWITGIAYIAGEILSICFLPDKAQNAWVIVLFVILIIIEVVFLIARENVANYGKHIVAIGVLTILFASVPGGILTVVFGSLENKERIKKSLKEMTDLIDGKDLSGRQIALLRAQQKLCEVGAIDKNEFDKRAKEIMYQH